MVSPSFDVNRLKFYYLGIGEDEWNSIFSFLISEELVKSYYDYKDKKSLNAFLNDVGVTIKGIEYLNNCNFVARPSAKVMLSVAQSEYDKVAQRTNIIDVKISAIIALLAFLYPLYIDLLSFKIQNVYHGLYLFALIVLLVMNAVALFCLLTAIMTRAYRRIDINSIINDSSVRHQENDFESCLLKFYKDAINESSNQNDKRVKYYDRAVKLIRVSAIIGLILIILKHII
jgi:hypothetical protein